MGKRKKQAQTKILFTTYRLLKVNTSVSSTRNFLPGHQNGNCYSRGHAASSNTSNTASIIPLSLRCLDPFLISYKLVHHNNAICQLAISTSYLFYITTYSSRFFLHGILSAHSLNSHIIYYVVVYVRFVRIRYEFI